MEDDRDEIVRALEEGLMHAWDWAIVEDTGHIKSGRIMAEAALTCLETKGFSVVKADRLGERERST